ncbi:MAG: isochorismatase family protein [Candidatus Obscuribacterales bacterium]|nr:isochorismatase family protein [Candidatus Obscuribacterales bacterium]
MTISFNGTTALIRVDGQNCFFPEDRNIPGTGELPVATAPTIVHNVNKLSASPKFNLVVDTADHHPPDHESFAEQHLGKNPGEIIDLHGVQQMLWTVHGRANTPGAEFHPSFDRSRCDHVVRKGTDKQVDSYSGFRDNKKGQKTDLADWLRSKGVTTVVVVGITRPFCASYTAKDAVDEGFETYLVTDACSMLAPEMAAADDADLTAHGVTLITAADIL